MFVNIVEIALVSLATRVTSLPTGRRLSCACDRLSIWVNSSSRMADRIFCPVFCSSIVCRYVHSMDTAKIPAYAATAANRRGRTIWPLIISSIRPTISGPIRSYPIDTSMMSSTRTNRPRYGRA